MRSKIFLYGSLIFIAICSLAAATCFGYAALGQGTFFKENIILSTPNEEFQYCGDYINFSSEEYKIEEGQLALGDYIVVEPTEKQLFDSGLFTNSIKYKILNANGQDVTSSYNIKENFGRILVNKRKVKVGIKNIDPNDVGSYLGQENLEIGGDGLGSNDEVSATVTKEYIGDAYGFSFELHVYNNLAHKDTSKNYYIDDGSGNTSFPDLDINFDLDDFPPDMELPDLDVLPDLDQLPEISGDGNIQFDGNSSFEFGSNSLSGYEDYKKAIFTFKSTQSGIYHLKGRSFGDYNGTGFDKAPSYDNNGYNPNDFFSYFIKDSLTPCDIEINYTSNVVSSDYDLCPYFYNGDIQQADDISYDLNRDKEGRYSLQCYLYDPQTNLDSINRLITTNDSMLDKEATYSVYVNNVYTKIDASLKERLIEFIYNKGLDTSTLRTFNDSLYKLFKDEYKYNIMAYTGDEGGDPVYDFLTKSKEGSCQNFASSATMLYRALGYPARFVTGFLAPYKTPNVEQTIYGIYAHAWVEVYIIGKGWIPLEYTVGAIESMLGGGNYEDDSNRPDDENATTNGSDEEFDFNEKDPNSDFQIQVQASEPGKYYLRQESYGDYKIDRFSDANIYKVSTNTNPNEFLSKQLKNVGFATKTINFIDNPFIDNKYLSPTYFDNTSKLYSSQNDIYYSDYIKENISIALYPYEYTSDYDYVDALSFMDPADKESESLYYYFVKDNYLEVPKDIENKIYDVINNYAIHFIKKPKTIVQLISNYLGESNLIYNPNATYDLSQLSGPIEDIINGGGIECDSSLIASAATLLLRTFDVPTRLVRGYLYDAKNIDISVINSDNLYFWNEIYLKGHGWVYVDFVSSSGLYNNENTDDDSNNDDEETTSKSLVLGSYSQDIEYDGNYHSIQPVILSGEENLNEGDFVYMYSNVMESNVGSYTADFTYRVYNKNGQDVTDSYNISYEPGSLNIYERTILVYTNSISENYENNKVISSEITFIDNWLDGYTYEGTGATLDKIGSIDSTYVIKAIYNEDGEDVFNNFNITYVYGKLEMI